MKNLDTTKILKRIIIVSWIALGCCFLIKLLGGNIFEIVCNNQRFIAICNYIDTHMWADWVFCTIYNTSTMYFLVLAICGQVKYTKTQMIILFVTVPIATFVKVLNPTVGLFFDIWQIIVMPCVFTIKKPRRHWCVLLGNVLIVIFQMMSMVIRNLSFGFTTQDGTLIAIIHSIDVTIMIFIYYLYVISNKFKKENKNE